ncbi:FG-GAP-like repeat-containing protein [Puia sp. P3]|uniref:FG-GAP-like repeat-containing protein n=1 Tax=Puia sp. P3 TaxID=3423952 RepID=UPI003D66D3D2
MRITGTHFYGTVSVKIAGVDVNSFTVVSDTQIDATAGFSQSGSLTVTTLFGSATIPGFTILLPPVIRSFSPDSGPIGTLVTITGNGFSPIAAENTVYLGPVRAIVTSATATQLVVKVPLGAGYQPISVTARNLTAYSQQPFTVSSPDLIRTLTDSSFTPRKDFDPGQYISSRIEIADLDADGKPDLAASTGSGGYIGVKRNTSSPGSLSFDPEISFGVGYFPNQMAASDIDGDGKLDLVTSGQDIFVFKNTSGGTGSISFRPVPVVTSHVFGTLAISDLNGDGKPDIVITNPGTNSVLVYGNVSTPDSIAFASPISLPLGPEGITASLAVGDLDADGKPEIVVTYAVSGVVIFHNTGGNGKFSFTQTAPFPIKSYFSSGASPGAVSIGDLDGDGKPDLAIALGANAAFSVMRNMSTNGTILFDKELQFTAVTNFTQSISLNDMDGDGKPDVTIDDNERDHVRVYKNISTVGNIGFSRQLQYDLGDRMGPVSTGDLDGDGKADIVATSTYFSQVVSVFRNRSEVAATTAIADTNYRIRVVNNTCRGKNDGKIIIDLSLPLTYSVKISADGFVDSAHFSGTNLERNNLAAGVYQICITIDSLPGYSRCFTANLTQPKDLAVLATVAPNGNSLNLLLGGSEVYIVDLNGYRFQTSDSTVVLPLQPGTNSLTVQTPLSCQGVIAWNFAGGPGTGGIRLVPNPVVSTATLYLPGTDNRVVIEVLGADGRAIGASRTYAVGFDRTVALDLSGYARGTYLVHVRGVKLNASIKLIKIF